MFPSIRFLSLFIQIYLGVVGKAGYSLYNLHLQHKAYTQRQEI